MNNSLLLENEALRARLNIRDFFLDNVVREIYENVGQILSLVRMELGAVRPDENIINRMEAAGRLVVQTIQDLRLMSKSFKPDADLLKSGGFTESVKTAIDTLYPENAPIFITKEQDQEIPPEKKLIVFSVFLKILVSITEEQQSCNEIVVSYNETALQLFLSYDGIDENPQDEKRKAAFVEFNEVISLLSGEISRVTKDDGMNIWKLRIPLK